MNAGLNLHGHRYATASQIALNEVFTDKIIHLRGAKSDAGPFQRLGNQDLITEVATATRRTATWEAVAYLTMEAAAVALVTISLV